MPRWVPGATLMVGALLLVMSAVGFMVTGGESDVGSPAIAGSTTQDSTLDDAGAASSLPTTVIPPSSSSSSSSTSPTTSTVVSTTSSTTTTVASEDVPGFIEAFAAALEAGDVAFIESRLHPDVRDAFGEALCRDWIEREVMLLSEYRLVSVDGGPMSKQLALPGGNRTIPDIYDATVSFVFNGEMFTNPTDFALVGTEMHWLGQCR